jgi:hypothetical protein
MSCSSALNDGSTSLWVYSLTFRNLHEDMDCLFWALRTVFEILRSLKPRRELLLIDLVLVDLLYRLVVGTLVGYINVDFIQRELIRVNGVESLTGMVLKDVPEDPPKLDSCPSCALAKAQRLPFKAGRMRATAPLELIHDDLVGPMPVESVIRCKYGFVLMEDYSCASWVLPLRAKSEAPAE